MPDYTTPEAVLALGHDDPEYAEATKAVPPWEAPWDDLPLMRQMVAAVGTGPDSPKPSELVSVEMRDGTSSEAAVFRPKQAPASGSPLVVLFFGGGFVSGSKEAMAASADAFATSCGATVVCPSYRLAPEHPFPAAPHDAWDALSWAAANAASMGADPRAGFVVGGISAGANLAAVTAQKSLDVRLNPPLTGVWLSIPPILDEAIVPQEYKSVFLSREQNAEAAILGAKGIDALYKHYQMDPLSPEWSPFNAPAPHKGMPPVYLQVSGQDPLRDDGLIYERALRASGVKTRLDVYPGVPHGFAGLLPTLKISEKHNADTLAGYAWLLDSKV